MSSKSYSGHQARKRFGQNFLQDPSIILQIIDAIHPTENECLIEIGPGRGALTQAILNKVSHLDVIELDRDLVQWLTEKYKSKLTIHAQDVLKFDFKAWMANQKSIEREETKSSSKKQDKIRIVGNLPYNISTPIIFHLVNFCPIIQDMHFMLQKEVVDRIVATPGSKAYGRLSVMVQYFCKPSFLFLVPPEAFIPQPKVMSAFLRLQPFEDLPFKAQNFDNFSALTKAAFQFRRKTLQNSLKSFLKPEDFLKQQIDPQARAETLSVQDFVALSNLLFTKGCA